MTSAARLHLERLAAEPRPAGSPAEERARGYCADRLSARGFAVQRESFTYSTWPGRWATPLGGTLAVAMLLVAGHVAWRGRPALALALLLVGVVVIAAASRAVAVHGVLRLPWQRANSVNLVATRGAPRVWLVAHLDSKSQPVPIALRALGVMALIVIWALALSMAVMQASGGAVSAAWPWIAALGAIAGAPVIASVVGARSPGALDDASGVATVLRVVELMPDDTHAGVLLTSAEELGLAGARAWVAGREASCAINVDGVDDTGTLRLTYGKRRPTRLLAALDQATPQTSAAVATGRLVPGVLLDAVALTDAGWEVVTVSRGTWRTVARIHTPADDLSRLTGDGVEMAALHIDRAVRALTT